MSLTKEDNHLNNLSRMVSGIDEADAKERYQTDTQDNRISRPNSSAESVASPEKKTIHWEDGDPENPYNWSSVHLSFQISTSLGLPSCLI